MLLGTTVTKEQEEEEWKHASVCTCVKEYIRTRRAMCESVCDVLSVGRYTGQYGEVWLYVSRCRGRGGQTKSPSCLSEP